jgi:hypothetical protein
MGIRASSPGLGGGRLYLLDAVGRMLVVDVSHPDAPLLLTRRDRLPLAQRIVPRGACLVMATPAAAGQLGRVLVEDERDPEHPQQLLNWRGPLTVWDVAIDGDKLLVAASDMGFYMGRWPGIAACDA